MKLVLVHPPDPGDAVMFDGPEDDPGHAPWVALRNALRAKGVEIGTTDRRPDDIERADWVCFMNVPGELMPAPEGWRSRFGLAQGVARGGARAGVWDRLRRAGRGDRAALFLWEPVVVLPENYIGSLHRRFTRVFTWSTELVQRGGNYRPLVWPQPSGVQMPQGAPFGQRKLLVNFSGNKTSPHPLELYSRRVEVIRYMEAHRPGDFDHYGFGWGKDFPSWRGSVPSKLEVYPDYRFGLCYENMHSVRGYVTEKIFDCLRAGVVPIYWGAPDIADVVDPSAFIDRRQFESTEALIRFIVDMDERMWSGMRDAGATYVRGSAFARFLPPAFCELVVNGLEK
jgi:hypothetical protein